MKPLNRPMFRYGGPIKEGIMNGMKDNRIGFKRGGGSTFNIDFGARTQTPTTSIFNKPVSPQGITYKSMFDALKTGGKGLFSRLSSLNPFSAAGTTMTAPFVPTYLMYQANKPKTVEALEYMKSMNESGVFDETAMPEDTTAFYKELDRLNRVGTPLEKAGVGLRTSAEDLRKLVSNIKMPQEPPGGGDSRLKPKVPEPPKPLSESELNKLNQDRIQKTKDRYYKLMGIDKMNKEAVYDSLIDASKIIQAEGGDLKGSITSGNLQTQLIDAISKNLDKSADLKKKIDQAVLSAEIQKDINKTKMSDFDKQLAILGPEGYRKKALGETSVADMVAATKAKGTLVNSDIVSSFIEAKGGKVTDTFDDTKYQKWEKNNTGKDEIDYITENFSTIDPGVYVVNGKAVQIGISEDGKKTANYVDLSTIIG